MTTKAQRINARQSKIWDQFEHERRVKACLNACEGIPTADLENAQSRPNEQLTGYGTACAQRDELLAALEACIADGFLAGEVLDQASAAIARATGEQS